MGAEPRWGASRGVWLALAGTAGGLVLLLQACFGAREAPTDSSATLPNRLSSPEVLAPFFVALTALGRKEPRQPVRIVQIGDSHTANDSFSGRMRDRLQERFGASGRGWLPAGIPYKYYRPHLVEVSESGWRHVKPSDQSGIALGLDVNAAQSVSPESSMVIVSTEAQGFDRFAVEFSAQPNGSAFTVTADDGAPVRVSTASPAVAIKRFDLPLEGPAHRVELRANGRPPVVLLGWEVERAQPGIVYENHGTIGATISLLEQMTPEAVSFELDQRRPALLIVAFGTNEGFEDGLDLDHYATRFAADVVALQRVAHGAPVLLLGPPDGNRVGRDCTPTSCRPDGDDCSWHAPAKLAAVRDAQRRIAAQNGWAYWDWFAAMGGACSIDRMAGADPPLAMRDHVHLSAPGYQAMADLLFDELMRDFEKWKAQPRSS